MRIPFPFKYKNDIKAAAHNLDMALTHHRQLAYDWDADPEEYRDAMARLEAAYLLVAHISERKWNNG